MSALSQKEASALLQRLPDFEMFYEITQHKTFSAAVEEAADVQLMTLHIPMGRKCLLWLTFHGADVGFVWAEMSGRKYNGVVFWQKVSDVSIADLPWFHGTLFYGTRTSDRFYIEDIYRFKGFALGVKYTQTQKWAAIRAFLDSGIGVAADGGSRLMVPVMNSIISPDYQIYSVQVRHLNAVNKPYVHYRPTATAAVPILADMPSRPVEKHLKKPQYGEPAIFRVMAEPSSDLYKLFAYGPKSSWIFYDYACIQTPESSRTMNRIFRRIRENRNIDLIEESDDEADEPVSNFTDCKKQVLMKCVFNRKWRKWEPVCQVAERTRATHISAL